MAPVNNTAAPMPANMNMNQPTTPGATTNQPAANTTGTRITFDASDLVGAIKSVVVYGGTRQQGIATALGNLARSQKLDAAALAQVNVENEMASNFMSLGKTLEDQRRQAIQTWLR